MIQKKTNEQVNSKKTTKPQKNQRNNSKQKSKAVREYTAGGVIFRIKNSKLEFLLLQDIKGRWSIPKGHVESGETLEQTAIREIGEETGLVNIKIIDKLDKIHFFYRTEGKLIFMTTFVFLIESTDLQETLLPEKSEGIIDVSWFDEQAALRAIEYKATKVLLEEGAKRIKKAYGIQ
ncbi:NUDIX domain-containing protein [Candidatus Saccharibacteria bacterium]|nr:NUDIX domain-containing protein [Candidatus Saccharibacteria bacterium]